MHGKKKHTKNLRVLNKFPWEKQKAMWGGLPLLENSMGSQWYIVIHYPSISWELTGLFPFPQLQQEAIIKLVDAAHACGEGSATSGIIIIEPEMKNR